MTCSLQIYRARIGTFFPRPRKKSCDVTRAPKSSISLVPLSLIILMIIYCCLIVNVEARHTCNVENDDWNAPLNFSPVGLETMSCYTSMQWHTWDPGITKLLIGRKDMLDFESLPATGSTTYPWHDNKQRNKLNHIINGNRERRGRGINCVYWNKGPSFLVNKQLDIKNIVERHKPHILGLGEANVHHDNDLDDLQLEGYSLHLDSCINNPQLGMARVAVYIHDSLRVKRRPDLEDDTVAAVWLECGLPGQKGILVCNGYRQWQLLGQEDSSSGSVSEQLVRWLRFLEMWEKALNEDK